MNTQQELQNSRRYNDGDPWMVAEDIPDIDFQFSQIWLSSFVNDMARSVGINYSKILCVYRGYNLVFYYGEKDSNDFAEHVLKKIIEDPSFGTTINDNIRTYSDQLKKQAELLQPTRLASLTNDQLADLYMELDALHTTLYTWGWLPNAVDMFHGNFTHYLKNILSEKLHEDEVNPVLVNLSVSSEKSVIDQEQESFLNLVVMKQAGEEGFEAAVSTHCQKYFFHKHLWIGKEGIYDEEYYQNEVEHFIASGQQATQVLKEKVSVFQAHLAEQRDNLQRLGLSQKQEELFKVYAEFAVTKVYRRDAQLYMAYMMDFMFAELASRLDLPLMACRFLFPTEVTEALVTGTVTESMRNDLTERTKYCTYYAEKDRDLLFTGSDATEVEKVVKSEVPEDITELHGQAACLGKATGTVKIVNSVADMAKIQPGDILVSIATNPDIVPAMKKAAAIITEQGGITSHAAIVSRELGIPCVIGTKIATKVLKDGDQVEVDANKGIVLVIK